MNERIKKIRQHIDENFEFYFAYTVGFTAGVVITRTVFGKTKINSTQVIANWLLDMNRSGYEVFALDAVQSEMWRDCVAAAQTSVAS